MQLNLKIIDKWRQEKQEHPEYNDGMRIIVSTIILQKSISQEKIFEDLRLIFKTNFHFDEINGLPGYGAEFDLVAYPYIVCNIQGDRKLDGYYKTYGKELSPPNFYPVDLKEAYTKDWDYSIIKKNIYTHDTKLSDI